MARFALLAVAFFLFLSGFFVAKIPSHPEVAAASASVGMETTSAVFVLLLALPSYLAALRWLGGRHGVLLLVVMGIFAVGVETLAVYTGFPYGQFAHGEKIGAKLFGAVPWTVPFAWTPLILATLALASRWRRELWQVLLGSALLLVLVDLLLDPVAVAQGFWEYRNPSIYYRVPMSNFVGWLVSGLLGSALFAVLTRHQWNGREALPSGLLVSGFLIFVFWTSVALWMGLVIPALIGVILTVVSGCVVLRSEPDTPVTRPTKAAGDNAAA